MMKSLTCAALLLSAASLVVVQDTRAQAAKPVTVDIKNAQGQSVGTATLTAVAKCEAPDFKSAGPHFGGGHAHEGMSMGAPAGDIPDFALIVAADGKAHASTVAPNVTLGTDENSVFSNGGTAIVIHAVAGGTGSGAPPRIACGVITKPE